MMSTPQGKKLVWTGKAFYSGTPSYHKSDFEAYGGMTKTYTGQGVNHDTWMDTNVRGAEAYKNPDGKKGGFSAYIAPFKPSKALRYLQSIGAKPKTAKAYDKPFSILTDVREPTSNSYNKAGLTIGEAMKVEQNGVVPYAPFHFAVSSRPLIDSLASQRLGGEVKGNFGIIGADLPRKAIFGGSGQYDLTDPRLFRAIIPFGLIARYLYDKSGDSSKESV